MRAVETSETDGATADPRAIRVVALDVDGTLAGADHRVSDRTVDVLRRLVARGVVPVVVTGRTEGSARALADRVGMAAPTISCNGAVVTDPGGERLSVTVMDPDEVRRVVAFGREHDEVSAVLWTTTAMLTEHPSPWTDLLAEVNDEPVTTVPLSGPGAELPADVVKVMLVGDPDALDALRDEVGRALPAMRRGMAPFFETSAPGASKREALRLVLDRLGVDPSACMGIADGDTDAAWLAEVGLPVAPANAMAAARQVARHHIGHHADDAVADFLEQFFSLPR